MDSVGSDDIGLVIPLLVAIKPLDVDVHVDVVVALPTKIQIRFSTFDSHQLFDILNFRIDIYLPIPDGVPFPVAEPFPI